ncbi:MAG: transposase [candidate division Zixibacteria bacterium]|nr:transposase [candidate division Zixibacteria bacterium]
MILDNQIYFITTTTRERDKVFTSDENSRVMLKIFEEIRESGAAKISAFVIMPDHLHLVVKPEKKSLDKIMQKIKGKSSRLINQLRNRNGGLWQREYFERAIRDEKDLEEKYQYIVYNPVKEGLAERPEEYPYSSAALKEMVDEP